MIIGSVNSYFKNANVINDQNNLNKNNGVLQRSRNNPNNQQLQKILSGNNEIPTIEKRNNNIQPTQDQKMEQLKMQLNAGQAIETSLQNGMSSLQEKDIGLDKIKSAGERLKELSNLYKDSKISEEDKKEVFKEAEALVKGIENLMNNTKPGETNVVGNSDIAIQRADGGIGILSTKGLEISLDFGKLEEDDLNGLPTMKVGEDKPFESRVSIEALLKSPSIIDERLLKPVNDVMQDVGKAKDYVFSRFVEQFSLVENSIDKLFESGGISEFSKNLKKLNHQMVYDAISSMRSQSSNLNRDRVQALLR